MRILVATDAWRPQINGVVHSLEQMSAAARDHGAEIEFLTPAGLSHHSAADLSGDQAGAGVLGRGRAAHRSGRAPTTSISPPKGRSAWRRAVIAGERGAIFTTSYHTRFPEYVAARAPIPERLDLCGAAPVSCARRRA